MIVAPCGEPIPGVPSSVKPLARDRPVPVVILFELADAAILEKFEKQNKNECVHVQLLYVGCEYLQ